jgi:UDP-glucose 4-epimerase
MTIKLVTGGAGFIGSNLAQALLARGEQVRVFDNFSTGQRSNLADLGGRLEVEEGDLRNADQVAAAVRGVDVIFHEAAQVSVPESMEDPYKSFAINVTGTLNLLQAASKAGVQKVVMASSCAVYGDSTDVPLSEDGHFTPLSPYAASKQMTETMAALYTQAFNLPVVCLRYFNVYGPRQSPYSQYAAVIPIFIHQILSNQPATIYGDGKQTRDFVYVSDVVKANLLAAENPQAGGKIFNVCAGTENSLLDLWHELEKLLPGAPPPRFAPSRSGDIYRSFGDPTKAARELGFTPQVSLPEGLNKTIEWMRK